jgi:hypothetical protein
LVTNVNNRSRQPDDRYVSRITAEIAFPRFVLISVPLMDFLFVSVSPCSEPRLAINWNATNFLFKLLKLNLRELASLDEAKPLKPFLKELVTDGSVADALELHNLFRSDFASL